MIKALIAIVVISCFLGFLASIDIDSYSGATYGGAHGAAELVE